MPPVLGGLHLLSALMPTPYIDHRRKPALRLTRNQEPMSIRNESKTRHGISPFYLATTVAIVALAVIGFLVATR